MVELDIFEILNTERHKYRHYSPLRTETKTTSPTHLGYQQRPVGQCLYLLHVERVEYSLVFCPSDELEGWMRLDMAVDDPTEVERQVLDGWGEHHPGRVCKLHK